MSNTITSFDTAAPGVFGDILNIRNQARRSVKVGFLGAGYFEYWRMYPSLRDTVAADLDAVAGRLSTALSDEVVFPGMVDTLDSAEKAGRAFAQAGVDVVVIVEGTYLVDFMVLHALSHVPEARIVLFSSQTGANVSPGDNYEATMRNSGLIGITQLSATFRKAKRPYHVVVGEITETACYQEIASIARAVRVRRLLQGLSIGQIGHVFRGMYDLECDKGSVRGILGPEVIAIQVEHLVDTWKGITDAQIAEAAAEFKPFQIDVGNDDLNRSVKLGLAMRELAKVYNLDALCFLGQHYIEKLTGAPARIGASMLMSQERMIVACEGDVGGLIMMQILQELTGNTPMQLEWGQFDLANNALFLLGHGICSPDVAKSNADVTLTATPEEWGFQGHGVNWQLILKPGVVTMGHFISTPTGWQMLISKGESIDFPCLPCSEIHAMVKVKTPVRDYIRRLIEHGVTHHVIVAHGDVTKELELLADMMGVEKFIAS